MVRRNRIVAIRDVVVGVGPCARKLNMPIEALEALTFCTVLSWKLNVPPLEA